MITDDNVSCAFSSQSTCFQMVGTDMIFLFSDLIVGRLFPDSFPGKLKQVTTLLWSKESCQLCHFKQPFKTASFFPTITLSIIIMTLTHTNL